MHFKNAFKEVSFGLVYHVFRPTKDSFIGQKTWQVFCPTKDVPDCYENTAAIKELEGK